VFSAILKRLQFNDLASSALILLFLTLTIQTTQIFSRLDHLILDIGQKVFSQAPPDDLIIVAIDEASLSQLGRWPWSRKTHADLLAKLTSEHAVAVGMDLILSEPEMQHPMADQRLADEIEKSGKVVLPVLLETTRVNGQMVETLPLPALTQYAADLGRVHAVLDEDSIARSVYLHEGLGAPTWQLFAQAVVNVANQQKSQNQFLQAEVNNPYTLVRKDKRNINFLGPPGHFKTISYAQVLKGDFEPNIFKNKIVLVGATALGMNDLLSTPVSGLGQPMSGVEFHANVIQSIRNQNLILNIPVWMSTLIALVMALLPLIWMPKVNALTSFLVTLLYMALVGLFMASLPKWFSLWIPPSGAVIPILVAYPIWSWRKLEAAQRFLDEELNFLRKNLMGAQVQNRAHVPEQYDVFDTRIAQVRMASEQLKTLQEDKKDTLAFISHDLRAPIGTALSMLERFPEASTAMRKPLSQALKLAEDFLQASRAEMMDAAKFNELELAGLVHQAIDDAYAAAIDKKINLNREVVEGLVWVNGNFGLLHRAALNLILNAVKYCPRQAEVVVRLVVDTSAQQAIFSVTDGGPGIALEEHQNLFKRFSRVKEQDLTAEGTGLGLYFVKTVIEKHAGSIHLQSDIGQPTTFSLRMPINGFEAFEQS